MARVLVPLARGFEELEAVTVIDLLRRAGIKVVVASLGRRPVLGSRGVRLMPDALLSDVVEQEFDMIVLPGGLMGMENLNQDLRVHRKLKRMAANEKYTAAICAAPKVLAAAGLLKDKKVTAYPGVLEADKLKDVEVTEEAVVVDEKIITSRGPGTAMDFALQLVEVLEGKEKRDEVEEGLVRG